MFLGRPFNGKQLSRKKNKVKSEAKVKTGNKGNIRSNDTEIFETRASQTVITDEQYNYFHSTSVTVSDFTVLHNPY